MSKQIKSKNWRMGIARFLIAAVIGWNLQVAYVFLLFPERFLSGFELSGLPGEAAMRGMAVLFMMWNVPYLVAFWNPRKYRVSLIEAIAMQSIGLIGESFILSTLGTGHALLRTSIIRFIIFDGAGLIFLIGAFLLTNNYSRK
ncbi:MAG: hypothetical protein HN390_12380 [Anaerolineae bacterium]|jgi:hypothetical protein|nr:hypothetical protein [Anaerolineae bacterium]MBT7192094.1 hypothetical protein [Anaerolineae bacterium]MBT7990170.1 hypothetical protein [Anaerolineae bacterium]